MIKGSVLEHASGRPLARATVRLDPVPRAGGPSRRSLTARAGHVGQFVLEHVSPGIYLLQAWREGYFPAAYGQRLPTGRPTPIYVTEDSFLVAALRLRHKGALTGQVLDENGVGMSGIPVVAYRARLPLRVAGRGESDDRGVFRVPGLEPGKYWARSAAHAFDDGSQWLPTYAPRGTEIREALTYEVLLDADTDGVDTSPQPGSLFEVGGLLMCDMPGPVTVTLSSETGRRAAESSCGGSYGFENVAPGDYQVFATLRGGAAAGFIELSVRRDMDAANVPVVQLPRVHIDIRRSDSDEAADIAFRLTGRRQDLSEADTAREITGPWTALAPGYWEFRAEVPEGHYVESIVRPFGRAPRRSRARYASDWYSVFIPARRPSKLRITVSDQAGQIAGRVVAKDNPVLGAPVLLWPIAESARRSLSRPAPQLLSDTEGHFHFDSLPAGDYRLLATFDLNEIDEELIERTGAATIHIEEFKTTTIDLPLWTAPW